jgi:hypothetical protein
MRAPLACGDGTRRETHSGQVPDGRKQERARLDCIHLAAFLASSAKHLFGCLLTDERFFDPVHALGRDRNTAKRQGGALDRPVRILFKQCRRGCDGEISMPARKLDEAIAMPLGPRWEAHADEKLVCIDGRRHEPLGKFGKWNVALAVLAHDTDGRIDCGRDRDQLGRRIEVTERTAECHDWPGDALHSGSHRGSTDDAP